MAFADFPDEKKIVALLQRSLERGRLAHAYLFAGATLGKLEGMARTLAKVLNCHEPSERGNGGLRTDSCDQCVSCRKIEDGGHPDIQWLRPESKSRVITIDQIRELMQAIYLKPSEANYKVAVIVAADRLNVQAANAFLKTLEEPPTKSIVLLLTTDPQRILETIISRCLRLNFAAESGGGWDDAQLKWLTQFSEAAMGPERSLLSRYRLLSVLLAKLAEIKADTEKTMAKRSPLERYDDIEPSLKEKWEDELTAAIEAEYRRQRSDLLLGLQWWLRDVWLQTLALGREALAFQAFHTASQTVAGRITPREAVENLRILEQTQRLLGSNVQEALALEVGFLRLRL